MTKHFLYSRRAERLRRRTIACPHVRRGIIYVSFPPFGTKRKGTFAGAPDVPGCFVPLSLAVRVGLQWRAYGAEIKNQKSKVKNQKWRRDGAARDASGGRAPCAGSRQRLAERQVLVPLRANHHRLLRQSQPGDEPAGIADLQRRRHVQQSCSQTPGPANGATLPRTPT